MLTLNSLTLLFVVNLSNITADATIEAFRKMFLLEDSPDIVTDNGRQFNSDTFQTFCTKNGIKHLTSAPFHPASNGEAERFVRTFKEAMKKAWWEGNTSRTALYNLLFSYRSMPHPNSGKSPAEYLHGRQLKTQLSLLLPQEEFVHNDTSTKFQISQPVYISDFSRGSKWIRGEIAQVLGKVIYIIRTNRGLMKIKYEYDIIPEEATLVYKKIKKLLLKMSYLDKKNQEKQNERSVAAEVSKSQNVNKFR